jgi:xanthomonalisin
LLGGVWLLFQTIAIGSAAELQILPGHVPVVVPQLKLQPISRLPAVERLKFTIGLPLRNREALTNLLQQLYDPASTNFHRYLNPSQFTARFGPTDQDYQRVMDFATTNGLEITKVYGDRVLLDVAAPVATAESAFHVTLKTYQHPTEARQFFAPDVEPSAPPDVPILHVSGLSDFFSTPHPLGHAQRHHEPPMAGNLGNGGSGYNGEFMQADLRNAYLTGTGYQGLYGGGQSVGLVEFEGYFSKDIAAYEASNSMSSVPLVNVPLNGFSGPNSSDLNGVTECEADIELAIAIAPFLSRVVIFESATNGLYTPETLLSPMVASNNILQFACCWPMQFDMVAEQYLMQMASQGQSFLAASGDIGAYQYGTALDYGWPSGDPYVTSVGGTELTMAAGSYVSETVWNTYSNNPYGDSVLGSSGGGVSTVFPIPLWQMGANAVAAGGSAAMRNVPDVAIVADGVFICYDGYVGWYQGTSVSAPLWAGLTALLNEVCAAESKPPVGFLNPGIYAIGEGSNYAACFHDIANGNSASSRIPTEYFATPGYDLCTGWGTPKLDLLGFLAVYGGATNVVYVDFSYSGTTQNGFYQTPFKTLSQATTAVAPGGTVIFKTAGSSSQTMTISKPMVIDAIGGAATIGN